MSEKKNSKVGYKKPPKNSQFKKGRSGNPRGRPKGSKNLKTIVEEEFDSPITLKEGGRVLRVSKLHAIVKALLARAANGNVQACTAVFGLLARVAPEHGDDPDGPLGEDDQKIISDFLNAQRSGKPKKGEIE